MSASNALSYHVATPLDCDTLVRLVNSSYRGEVARQGSTNENEFLHGQRTDINALYIIINSSEYIILVFFDGTDEILKVCVHLQHQLEINTAYLGMLIVRPDLQGKGYEKIILSAAEKYAINQCNVIYIEITVVIQRTELIDYYNRRGYVVTGKREPFPPYEFGFPKRNDLEFCILRKSMKIKEEKT